MNILKSLILTIVLGVGLSSAQNIAFAQNNTQGKQTLNNSLLDGKKYPFVESISVGVDLVGAATNVFSSKGEYQAFVQANLKGMYLPILEVGYGRADKSYEITDIKYKTSAPFFRLGVDYNIMNNKHDNYRITIGMRYGFSKFNYDTTEPTDSLHTVFKTTSDKCTLHWLELCAGVDAKVWGPLHMGWSIRYRRRLSASAYTKEPLYAPGFGDASNPVQLMALYNIGIQF